MPIYEISDGKSSKVLKPSGGNSIINVVDDYAWSLSDRRHDVPAMRVTEYQQNTGQLLAGMYFYAKQTKATSDAGVGVKLGDGKLNSAVDNPYEYLYFAKPTGFTYNFPYLGSDKFQRNTAFSYEEGKKKGLGELSTQAATLGAGIGGDGGGSRFGKAFKALGKVNILASAVGGIASSLVVGKVGLVHAKSWVQTDGSNYTVDFDLLNTFKDTNEIRKNRELAYLLTYQNSPYRRNFAITDPVCIYQIFVPDVVHLPAAFIKELSVTNLGNTRQLNLDGVQRIIPEAYRFKITFSSLLEESRNIFAGMGGLENKINAISEEDLTAEALLAANIDAFKAVASRATKGNPLGTTIDNATGNVISSSAEAAGGAVQNFRQGTNF